MPKNAIRLEGQLARSISGLVREAELHSSTKGRPRNNLIQIERSFWLRVAKTDHCWDWVGKTDAREYGRIKVNGKEVPAHRFSWFIHFGEPDLYKMVCHLCDNPRCVNPSHLFEGTQKDNMSDCSRKQRTRNTFPPGNVPHNTRLTFGCICEIRDRLSNGEMAETLADVYGVTSSHISAIKLGKVWTR